MFYSGLIRGSRKLGSILQHGLTLQQQLKWRWDMYNRICIIYAPETLGGLSHRSFRQHFSLGNIKMRVSW